MAKDGKGRSRNKSLGAFGENLVAQYVERRGGVIEDRNWRIKEGEIDLVARHRSGVILFIEVKTRSSISYGHPLEAITSEKAHRLQRLALAWLATHQCLGSEYRIDCAAVMIAAQGPPSIDYREGVL